jgi:hypothetical protein
MSNKETLKTLSLIDINELVIEDTNHSSNDDVLLIESKLDIEENLYNKSTANFSRIILKAGLDEKFLKNFEWETNERGEEVLKNGKVPGGYIAKNKDGKILLGGQFVGKLTKDQVERGDPWEFIPAYNTSRNPTTEENKLLLEKLKNPQNIEDVLYVLPKILNSRNIQIPEEGITLEKIAEIIEQALPDDRKKPLLDILRKELFSVEKEQEATQKIAQPNTNLDEGRKYYVYDAEKGLLADLPTYVANKDKFSSQIYVIHDDLTEYAAKAQSGLTKSGTKRDSRAAKQAEKLLSENIQLYLMKKIQDEDYDSIDLNNELSLIMPLLNELNSDYYRFGLGIPQTIIDNAEKFIDAHENSKLKLSMINATTGFITEIPEDLRKFFYTPDTPEGIEEYSVLDASQAKEVISQYSNISGLDTIYSFGTQRNLHPGLSTPSPNTGNLIDRNLEQKMREVDLLFESQTSDPNMSQLGNIGPIYKISWSEDDMKRIYKEIGLSDKEIEKYTGKKYKSKSFGFVIPVQVIPKFLEHFGIKTPNNLPSFKEDATFHPHQVKAMVKAIVGDRKLISEEDNISAGRVGMFFAHSTGTGKTITGLATTALRRDLGLEDRPTLIIAPEQIADRWIQDASLILKGFGGETKDLTQSDVIKISGNPSERYSVYEKLKEVWAKKQNPKETVSLPKFVILKTSTLQKARKTSNMGSLFREGDTFASQSLDRFYLSLLGTGGRYNYTDEKTGKQNTADIERGMFGNVIIDEASMVFDPSSQRRLAVDSIIQGIKSDRGQGSVYVFNANAAANSTDDLLSMYSLVQYDSRVGRYLKILDDGGKGGAKPTRSNISLNIDALRAMEQSVDIVGLQNLRLEKVQINTKVKPVFGNVTNQAPNKVGMILLEDRLTKTFLSFAALSGKKGAVITGSVYSPKSSTPEDSGKLVPKEVFSDYLPGFISMLKDMNIGAVSWRRLWEYGFLDTGPNEYKPFIIKNDPLEPNNKEQAANLETAVVSATIEEVTSNPKLTEFLELFVLPRKSGDNGPVVRQGNFIELVKKLKEENISPEERKKIESEYKKEVERFLSIYDEVQQLTRTYGLGSLEIDLLDNIRENEGYVQAGLLDLTVDTSILSEQGLDSFAQTDEEKKKLVEQVREELSNIENTFNESTDSYTENAINSEDTEENSDYEEEQEQLTSSSGQLSSSGKSSTTNLPVPPRKLGKVIK